MTEWFYRVARVVTSTEGRGVVFGPLHLQRGLTCGDDPATVKLQGVEPRQQFQPAANLSRSPVAAVRRYVAGQLNRIDEAIEERYALPGQPSPREDIDAAIALLALSDPYTVDAPPPTGDAIRDLVDATCQAVGPGIYQALDRGLRHFPRPVRPSVEELPRK